MKAEQKQAKKVTHNYPEVNAVSIPVHVLPFSSSERKTHIKKHVFCTDLQNVYMFLRKNFGTCRKTQKGKEKALKRPPPH